MKKLIFIFFSAVVVAGSWFYSDMWLTFQAEQEQKDLLQQDILVLEAEHEEVLAQLVDEVAKTVQLREDILSLKGDLTEALKPEFISLLHKDADASRRFIKDETDFWFLPGEDQSNMGTIDAGTLVQVIQETHNKMTGKEYLYIEIVNYAEPENTRGYILKEGTVYFTPDLETQVMNPLILPIGSVIIESGPEGDQESVLTEDMTVFKVGVENGMAILGSVGGQSLRTEETNIQYPQSSIE